MTFAFSSNASLSVPPSLPQCLFGFLAFLLLLGLTFLGRGRLEIMRNVHRSYFCCGESICPFFSVSSAFFRIRVFFASTPFSFFPSSLLCLLGSRAGARGPLLERVRALFSSWWDIRGRISLRVRLTFFWFGQGGIFFLRGTGASLSPSCFSAFVAALEGGRGPAGDVLSFALFSFSPTFLRLSVAIFAF